MVLMMKLMMVMKLQKSHLILKNLRWKGFLLFAMVILIMLRNQECILRCDGRVMTLMRIHGSH
ncbi:hypothetical protein PIB30_084857 [Stylosanthes scabra]|uniref:Uncharacterized protein n=1 Tax=Stylosanthes scabra TaxID=79078 RepID=A0ABU6ZR81_9FABA|nr:hypothetical protein [Stylosanthes scabra]